ncbi:MAG: nucleoside-triphosphatase [Ignavibacteria bacterium]|nr:nucleoside-triphosphatase [Ignavibacteria bacterium]
MIQNSSEVNRNKIITDRWIRASVLGSIWASTEIIAGNFLHNLRIPFTGEILTFFAVFFLTAASVRWKVKGIIWRAGIICALMKFFSPGVAVFGPMIGIISESLVLEFGIRLLGLNLAGFILGGTLAVCLPLVQKIVNYLIMYGWNLLIVFDKTAEVMIKLFGLQGFKSVHLLIILFSINASLGLIAAISGFIAGKKKSVKDFQFEMKNADDNLYNNNPDANPKSIIISMIINVVLTISLLFIIKYDILISGILIFAFIAYSLFRYKNTARLFRNYKFWLQIIFFTSLSGIIFAYFSGFGLLKGVLTGIEMLERVLLLTVGFALISIELRKPESVNFIRKKLSPNLSLALNSAFSAVPEIISTSKGIFSLLRPSVFIQELTSMMDYWYEKFKLDMQSNKIIIITGSQGAGKSTLLKRMNEKFVEENKNVTGLISEVVYNNGGRTGYDVTFLPTGEKYNLCRTDGNNLLKLGNFFFDSKVFDDLNERIIKSISEYSDILILDEIGLLEKSKQGWFPIMNMINQPGKKPLLIAAVRKNILEDIKLFFGNPEIPVYDLDVESPDGIFKDLISN